MSPVLPTPGMLTLNVLGLPLGLSLKLGALGLGRFRALPPIIGSS